VAVNFSPFGGYRRVLRANITTFAGVLSISTASQQESA
jgi:hypothetical protein